MVHQLEYLRPRAPIVLVVDDDYLVRELTADILVEEGGFRVIAEANADHALTLLQVRPDVQAIVTDVDMPGPLDGIALAREVAKRWPHIGVVVASGKVRPGPGDLPKGAHFLPKPYSPSTLLDEVRIALAEGDTSRH